MVAFLPFFYTQLHFCLGRIYYFYKMKKLLFIVALFGFIYFGCKGKGGEQSSEKIDSTTFFETSVIFKNDIKEVDSTAFYIYKIDVVNDKKDSTTINKNDFKQLAEKF